ncbi:hypothetical protein Hsar01_01686 [Haloferula sargassicola]|uniref:Uncharacterized protein n=1 Tax=Haloferula sargassicola TaxID=490096 RepID=A0ABP9USZ1_9BACT
MSDPHKRITDPATLHPVVREIVARVEARLAVEGILNLP